MELLTISFTHTSWTETLEMLTVVGVLRTEPDGLALEFRQTESDLMHKAREGEIQTVHIPWSEVQSLTYKKRWLLGDKLTLRTRSLRALQGVPAAKGNELEIALTRAERTMARELAANVELALAEQHLAALHTLASRSVLPPD